MVMAPAARMCRFAESHVTRPAGGQRREKLPASKIRIKVEGGSPRAVI